jgi:hypothetical protein
MAEEPHLEELSQTVSSGLLAEEVVYATSRLLRSEPLESEDEQALEQGRALLDYLAAPEPGLPRIEGFQSLATGQSALDTLRAARTQASGQDVTHFLRTLIGVLDDALNRRNLEGHHAELETVRTLFLNLGRVTLARANSLSRTPEDRLTWLDTTLTSASSSPARDERSANS